MRIAVIVLLNGQTLSEESAAAMLSFFPESAHLFFVGNQEKQVSLPARSSWLLRASSKPWFECCNELANTDFSLLFFWDTRFIPLGHAFSTLYTSFLQDPSLCGVNPLFVSQKNIVQAGLVFDSQRCVHSLYDGSPLDACYVQKKRFFHIAQYECLLIRLSDFLASGGFSSSVPEELLGFDLTMRMCKKTQRFFATIPESRVLCSSEFLCMSDKGLWNSYRVRGTIPENCAEPDWYRYLAEDGFIYGVNTWLSEGSFDKARMPLLAGGVSLFRRENSPKSLLSALAAMDPKSAAIFVSLCQQYPYYLPFSFPFYDALSQKKLAFAREHGLLELEADIVLWRKRMRLFHYKELRKGINALASIGVYAKSLDMCPSSYDAWIELVEKNECSSLVIGEEFPTIAVLLPCYNAPIPFLEKALASIFQQKYTKWELALVDDASSDATVRTYLSSLDTKTKNIQIHFSSQNGHISRATNTCFSLSHAPYVTFLDQDDMFAPDAFLKMANTIAKNPALHYVFSDEDKIDVNDVRRTPIFKSPVDFSLLRSMHMATVSRTLFLKLGGFRPGFEGAQDFDFVLRMLESVDAHEIAHIPAILYHWRVHAASTAGSIATKHYALDAQKKALIDQAKRMSQDGLVVPTQKHTLLHMRYDFPKTLSYTLCICEDGSMSPKLYVLLKRLMGRACETLYLVPKGCGNSSLLRLGAVRTVPVDGENSFLHAALCARGQILLFIATSYIPYPTCYPEQLVVLAANERVSAVFGYIFSQGFLLSMGYFPDRCGKLIPLGRFFPKEALADIFVPTPLLTHRCLGGSCACFALRKDPFVEKATESPLLYVLQKEREGFFALCSPFAQGDHIFQEEQSFKVPDTYTHFIAKHPLRNPNFHGSADYGWTLI